MMMTMTMYVCTKQKLHGVWGVGRGVECVFSGFVGERGVGWLVGWTEYISKVSCV